ncbi:patatin-like phospholipase family protein [Candidatus Bipolaricaulota bacterium]|nr:patatin-like phospholipase family protein [Candidatus Bipolaricaulota bacterium]
MPEKERIGLVLGSGGARGSAHVGVLKVLVENGIEPDVIAGTSMGAEVGGAYAAGVGLDRIEQEWRSTHFTKVFKTLFPTVPWAGWSSGREVMRTIRLLVGDRTIESLPIPYAALATDLESGLPFPITKGPLATAIRASVSVPGLFVPIWIDGHLLIDGGVSNPAPIDVARSLGATKIIAVDVLVRPDEVQLSGIPVPDYRDRILGITKGMERLSLSDEQRRKFYPNVFTVLFQMSTVFQKRVSNLMLQLHPPDVLIQPEFSPDPPSYSDVKHGIEAGEEAARRALPEILALVDR